MKVEPISHAAGARIIDIDLSQEMDATTFSKVHQAWLDYHVLVFPGQDLSEEDQVRYTQRFGEPGTRSRNVGWSEKGRVSHPGTMLISNIREDGKTIGSLPDGEMLYHSDGAYAKRPYRYTLLYAMEIPSSGGNTLFANTAKAYEALPKILKSKLENCHAEHMYYANNNQDEETRSLSGLRQHPLIVAHEETGKPAIYASRLMTSKIVELTEDESNEVLHKLFDHLERPEFVYEHVWTPGDFVVWDNRCLNHARTDFSEGERRLLRRTTVWGVDPKPYKVQIC